MKHLISLLFLLISSMSFCQTYDINMKLRSGQSDDSVRVLLTDISGALKGRGHFRSIPYLATLLNPIIGDKTFYNLGTTDAALASDDSIETTNVKYLLFNGLSGGLPTKIEMLKDGSLQFANTTNTFGSHVFMRVKDIQQDQGNVNWNEWVGSTSFGGSAMNDFTMNHGFNLAGGGGVEQSGKTGWGESFEYHYAPTTPQVYSEWQRVFYDSTGVEHRIESYILNKKSSSFGDWYGYSTVGKYHFINPTDNGTYLTLEKSGTVGMNFKMLSSATATGANWELDASADQISLVNNGMTNPHIYLFNSGTSFVHCRYFNYLSSSGTATSIAGQDGSGFLTSTAVGYGLNLTSGTLLADSSKLATQYDLYRHKTTQTASTSVTLTTASANVVTLTSNGAKTVSLPNATTSTYGYWYYIVNHSSSGTITVSAPETSDTINGTLTILPGESATWECTDNNYWDHK